MEARLAAAGARPVPQIYYWQANGDVGYQDPDGREVVFASWIFISPGSWCRERCNAADMRSPDRYGAGSRVRDVSAEAFCAELHKPFWA